MVTFLGSGSKTSVIWRLLHQLVSNGEKVVLTTTTYILEPKGVPVLITIDPEPGDVVRTLLTSTVLVLAAKREECTEALPADPNLTGPFKLLGVPPQVLNDLARRLPGVTWLVEADKVKKEKLAMPIKNGVIVPPTTNRLVLVADIEAVGQALDADTVYQPELAAQLLNVAPGTRITSELVAKLLGYTALGLSRTLKGVEIVALLAQYSTHAYPEAERLARLLMDNAPIKAVCLVSLSSAEPVLGVWQ
ncbi:MAG: putative selenium-dependent hydroxylase accessory protein YqeC [Anaerolineae bacterium]|nr:putative selenium-dependent hydroxylase accessory protein YqeC [Anaerolineae bacterium]